MTTSNKAANYTAQNVERMVAVYTSASTDSARKEAVQSLAKELGKNFKSIIAKLSREGVYVTAEKVTKSGTAVVRKDKIVSDIALALGVEFKDIKSLTSATKADLEKISARISLLS